MSRYIDAEWLEENAKQYSLGYYDYDEWATPLNVLDSAPSIDIVRCKDCKNNPKYTGDYMYGSCLYCCEDDRYSGTPSDDFFCGRGERRESDE